MPFNLAEKRLSSAENSGEIPQKNLGLFPIFEFSALFPHSGKYLIINKYMLLAPLYKYWHASG